MKRVWVIAGAVIIAFSILMPLVFLAFRFLPFGVLDDLTAGVDLFCCCGMGLPFSLAGVGAIIHGLTKDGTDR